MVLRCLEKLTHLVVVVFHLDILVTVHFFKTYFGYYPVHLFVYKDGVV